MNVIQQRSAQAVTFARSFFAKSRALALGAAVMALPLITLPQTAVAQNLFAPAATVNDAVVTNYELRQRITFLRLLRQPGDIEAEAIKGLIDDRLRRQASKLAGITVSDAQIATGMDEFAGRAQLTGEQFIAAIGQEGVAPETFRDFVSSGIAWRELVGSRYAPRVQITEAEIDRALALASGSGGVRVLLSEIIIPAPPEQIDQARAQALRISRTTSTAAGFAAQARNLSASQSRGRGGRIDWLPIGNLPPQIRSQVLALSPGEITAPIEVPGAVALFMLRAIEETDAAATEVVSIEYARYFIPGGRTEAALSEAQKIGNRVDSCEDLYGTNLGQDASRLQRDTLAVDEIPQDIALELARLDENEYSTALSVQGENGPELVFLMLCGRVNAIVEDTSREDIRANLRQQRLASYADSLLAELRADATITIAP
ncbi:peptidylprolyl isomerase [Halocynthiibacter namhaensis]|uniref:peptidylprolyl isomerase n=1 Tax=Halocynthiibacter namhaensis TaxID=1290553 RepID=UPI0012E04D1C|nr:peptidylprolyl isomerase [Halocynthiibacter namhaensis]